MIKPIAVTCGDPSGIGLEVTLKAWDALGATVPMVWLGDPAHLPKSVPFTVLEDGDITTWRAGGNLGVCPIPFAAPPMLGQEDPQNAAGTIHAIEKAVALTKAGLTSAVCTSPINKKVLMDGAGFAYPGHTEFLEALAGGDAQSVMMLASDALRVVPTTIHIALSDVPQVLTPDLLRATIRIVAQDLRRWFGIPAPRISVAGLNPHAGEGGKMGREEVDWIARIVNELRNEGLDVSGPWPGDTLFHAAARAQYDVVVAMYHDQALIPIKTLDFDRGVNITLGLPFIRTSPDHGTAYNIAGQGVANPTSMMEALKYAWRMAGGQI
ncbi:MAG: 4-hydroxythreonine-4-phosphate dehydrogenase PdxA [Rhodobacteraceae bacterium]|nr:4-hydroxythreonine-4-phosphate dehydrogenase PdxA [Paracoccaceae bacterium]